MQHARSRPMLPPLVALGALLLALLGVECQANASRCCAIAGALGLGPGAPGGLPVVVVNTSGVELVMDGPNTRATMCTCGAPEEFDGFVEISVRGSSSAREPGKKSFSMSLLPPAAVAGNDTKSGDPDAPFMGMPAAEKWNLYGAQRDRSLGIRNFLAMAFGRAMGRNASRTAWFEMVLVQDALPLNPSHYWGLYLAMEKIERGKERVDIKKLTPKDATGTAGDVTGGYIVRFEHGKMKPGRIPFNASLPGVSPNAPPSPRALPYILEYPDLGSKKWSGDAMAQARNRVLSYIARYMGAIEAAFARGADSTMAVVAAQGGGGADWRSLVDEGAFIDYFFGTEFTKNPDGYRGSIYMSKDAGKKLAMGPMWDYDEAFGMCCGYPIEGFNEEGVSNGTSGGSAISPQGWRFNICDEPRRCVEDKVDGISLWYRNAWKDPSLRSTAAARWATLRAGPLSDTQLTTWLNETVATVEPAAIRNYARWATYLSSPFFTSGKEQYEWEVRQLSSWVFARARWMDEAMVAAAT